MRFFAFNSLAPFGCHRERVYRRARRSRDCHGAFAPRNDKGKTFSASSAVYLSRNVRGFTLLEILIVTIIIALVAGIGIPRFIGSLERAEIKSTAGEIASVMRLARLKAVSEKTIVTVVVDTKSRTVSAVYGGEEKENLGDPMPVPESVTVWTGHQSGFYNRSLSIEFSPAGTATGGELFITSTGGRPDDGEGYLVRLNPLSGRTVVIPAYKLKNNR
jgi:prepilin-type N-terminal cleavage/methylation domain-containing protein